MPPIKICWRWGRKSIRRSVLNASGAPKVLLVDIDRQASSSPKSWLMINAFTASFAWGLVGFAVGIVLLAGLALWRWRAGSRL